MGTPRLVIALPVDLPTGGEPLFDREHADEASRVYLDLMQALQEASVPFLLGGTFALCHYVRVTRRTKDLDVFLRRSDVPRALAVLSARGYGVEVPYPHWLAKAHKGAIFTDLIHNSGNGVAVVDDEWFTHASSSRALGLDVQICPVEETIWSKAYIMERERYDGADVVHLLHACAATLDWDRLLRRFGAHWRVLFSHLVLFGFIYPSQRDLVPPRVLAELMARLRNEGPVDAACGGTLLSREQFLVDVQQWGYDDSRIIEGSMNAEDIARWTPGD